MWQQVRKVMLILVLSVICSLAVVGMITFMLQAFGIHISWLLALLSLPPGIALGLYIALSLSRQLLVSDEDTHQRRGTEANE